MVLKGWLKNVITERAVVGSCFIIVKYSSFRWSFNLVCQGVKLQDVLSVWYILSEAIVGMYLHQDFYHIFIMAWDCKKGKIIP